MTVLEGAWMIFEVIFVLLIILLALALLIAIPTLIFGFARELHKRWYDRAQAKQGSDEEVAMGTIASGGNEQDVEYGFVATDNGVEELGEREEEVDG